MFFPDLSYTTWITLAAFLGPFIVPRLLSALSVLIRISNGSYAASAPARLPSPQLSAYTVGGVAFHTIYHLRELIHRLPNLFLATGLPLLSTPVSRLQHALLTRLTVSNFRPERASSLAAALHKLQSYDNRLVYARYGERTLVDCEWCAGGWDYLAYWSAGRALIVVGEILAVGALASGMGKTRWRGTLTWAVVLGGLVELGWTWSARIEREMGQGFQLSQTLHIIHHSTLLFLPLVLWLLPNPLIAPPSPIATLPPILPRLESLLQNLKILEVSRVALARSPSLRLAVSEAGEEAEREGQWGRKDEEVVRRGEAVGMTAGMGISGGLMEGARAFLVAVQKKIGEAPSPPS